MADAEDAYRDEVAPDGTAFRPLYDANIRFNLQPVAVAVAETAEIARHAASLVRDYAPDAHATDLAHVRGRAVALARDSFALSPSKPRGDAGKAFAAAQVRHEAEYVLPIEHHNPMEMFGSTVIWHGDGKITVHDKTQGVQNVQKYLCGVFGLKPEDVCVVSPFMGGGFGSGLRPQYNVALAVLAALAFERSVRLVLSRPQMYSLGFRPRTVERVALGARTDGTLESMTHEAIAMTSQFEAFARKDTIWGAALYKCPNTEFAHKLVHLDVSTPADMRAPGAASGVYALECAMDELAVILKVDPIELRLRNHSDQDQNTGLPYTSKAVRDCYRLGAGAFGWNRRTPAPASMRDGSELVGLGMAGGIWEALEMPFTARVVMTANGYAEVSCAASDIGTGTYTVMTQIAAEALGVPLEAVTATLGDSTLPHAPVEGGSWTAASIAHAIIEASGEVRAELLHLAQAAPGSPLAGASREDVVLVDGKIASKSDPARAVSVTETMRLGGVDRIVREKSNRPRKRDKHATAVHSAVLPR